MPILRLLILRSAAAGGASKDRASRLRFAKHLSMRVEI
jgi:hypothetical protein